ncbi:MAG: D-alanyl-D-alanine carboxypeptidase [Tyzzerella sp.]|nr:D-alanyl-D-alanine carboxypeptidase [Tyzzerella sp.]
MRIRKVSAMLSMAVIFLVCSIKANAVNVVQVPAKEVQGVYNQSVDSNSIEGWAKGPHIYSEAGIVMDIDSGAILYAKNIDNPHYPASITKILTGLVALENNELTDTVTITPEDYNFLKRGDNHIGLKNKEEITMEDALHGTLLASGNEAAHALGSNTEGGYDNFIKLMNEKAKELGCTNSNFVNSHGLHDDNHYTSARDMALIGAAAFKNADFRRITATKLYTIPETNVTNEKRAFENHHKMLFDWRSQYYEYCVGGKTGYTDNALNTLVTFATKDDVNLVAVVLRTHGSGNTYVDTRAMLDYAFENFTKISVTVDAVEGKGLKAVDENAYVMVPTGITYEQLECSVENPKELGDKTGEVSYTYEGQAVGSFEMTITDEYYNELHGIEEKKEEKKEAPSEKPSVLLIVLKVLLVVVIIIAVLFLALLGYVSYKRAQKRKRRKARRMKRNP